MLVSRELRNKNISEYLLYMFHIEDMLRALAFSREMIHNHIIRTYTPEMRAEAEDWYMGLCDMMKHEGVDQKGHVHLVRNAISETEVFLRKAVEKEDEELSQAFEIIQPLFHEIRSRNPSEIQTGVVEMALNIMYWYMARKLAGQEVNEMQTEQIRNITTFLAVLSKLFNRYEKGEYPLD